MLQYIWFSYLIHANSWLPKIILMYMTIKIINNTVFNKYINIYILSTYM